MAMHRNRSAFTGVSTFLQSHGLKIDASSIHKPFPCGKIVETSCSSIMPICRSVAILIAIHPKHHHCSNFAMQ
eukprot:scaffold40491_cov41-Prasinocladus_malaysianus.AAC.2